MASKTLLALALASLVAAVNQAPNVPVSGQIGALDFGITCEVPIFGNKTFEGLFKATAPIQGIAGEQIYYDDLIAYVTIPGSITSLGGLIGGKGANANVKVALALDNATPANYQVFPNGLELDDIPFTPGQPVTARVPMNGTLAPIGPITLGDAGKTHLIHLGEVDIAITVVDGNGKGIFGPIPITCPAPSIPYDIGIVNILPATAGPISGNQSVGTSATFANITNGEETGSFRFPYTCDFKGIGKHDVDLSVTGTIPTYANPNQKISITDAYAYLRGDNSFVAFIAKAHPKAASITTTVSNYTLGVANGSPATLQVLKSPIVSPYTVDGQGIGIAFPSEGTLTIGPVTAGMAGEELFLTSGDASGSLTFADASGKSLGSSSFTCAPKYASKLIGIPVTNIQAPAISS